MGNNPSTNNTKSPASASTNASVTSSPSSQEHSRAPSTGTRRDPKHLIHPQRVAAPPEQSFAQARGSTTTPGHRPRNSQSHNVAHHSHSSSGSQASPAQSRNSPAPQPLDTVPGAPQSQLQHRPAPTQAIDVKDQPTKPVDVPVPASNVEASSFKPDSELMEAPGLEVQDMSYITRPPRLPLPIEEEVHTPGSPIIAPADLENEAPILDVDPLDSDVLATRTSTLSNTTIDEEDAEELRVDKTKATVPTAFEWLRGGEKVYVTGTIFQWNKKHRLHPVEGQPDILRAVINVRPGTHHIRFIVDSVMQCSPDLPTTVDFGNNLVNYIEVSPDDLPRDESSQAEPIPSATEENQQTAEAQVEEAKTTEQEKEEKPAPKVKPVSPSEKFTNQIPQYLLDLEKPEESSAYQHAAVAIEKLPSPPTLPGFLGKPILNAATPMKDDNSVLTMPNHTVLNHLATSSIKNNVLAVSATTRYKRKYVTTIMYKPTGDD
ncbi:hypothetical protein F5884DRAFT_768741 [Xylogone sp. PMI_703]|nr:hypothetical protein F5884DRAFT_768741 [Xylogone sp. PMI_703]